MFVKNFMILLGLGILIYANALRGPFMLDDYPFLSQFQKQSVLSHFVPDPHKQLGIDSAKTQKSYYRPLAHVIPHLAYLIFKNKSMGFHAVNLLLLVLAAWCVVLMLSVVLSRNMALAAGVLFMAHPVNGIMVNYITASVFAAQAIFMCLALWFLVKQSRSQDERNVTILSVLFFILALLCHETSFMIPFYAVLLCLAQKFEVKTAFARARWLWGTLLAYMVFRSVYVPLSNSLFYSLTITGLSWDQSMANIFQLLAWYARKLLFPTDIFLMWSMPFVRQASWDVLTMAVIGLGLAGFLLRRLWRLEPRAVVFFIWFIVGLWPIFLGAFASPYLGALVEPHWFIPATIGLFAGAVLLGDRLIRPPFWRKAVFIVVTLALLMFAWANNRLWSNEVKFYERWLSQAPQFKAIHYFLATVYAREGKYDPAREHFQQSILGRYKDWMVYLDLARLDIQQGHLDEARENLNKAYALEPKQSDILNGLGTLEFKFRSLPKAREWFEQAVKVNRFNPEARMNLALVYRRMGEHAKAVEQYEEILRLTPDFAPARQALEGARR